MSKGDRKVAHPRAALDEDETRQGNRSETYPLMDGARTGEIDEAVSSLVPKAPSIARRMLGRLWQIWLPLLFFLTWQVLASQGEVEVGEANAVLPPPSAVISAAQELIERGQLLPHVMSSLQRVIIAAGVAALVGIPLGLAMGWSTLFRKAVNPLLEFLRPIPPLAWIPLSILWFGIGDRQNQFIIFLAAFFPIMLNTLAGVRGVNRTLVRVGLSLGANRKELFTTVILPAAMPSILTGLRVGVGIGWMALVAAELVAANDGLGFLINNARTLLRSDHIVLGMIIIGILGLMLDLIMRGAARMLMPWYRRQL